MSIEVVRKTPVKPYPASNAESNVPLIVASTASPYGGDGDPEAKEYIGRVVVKFSNGSYQYALLDCESGKLITSGGKPNIPEQLRFLRAPDVSRIIVAQDASEWSERDKTT